ncbi:MAG: NUDIX hydrolase [Verrucomicrobia bacterium]|nr:MAG: NUDIX hydrolase [Verrucomicrobiota bacterium]
MKPWKRLGSRHLVRDQWISLRADRVELPNGHVLDPYYVIEDKPWGHVLALDERERVLLVGQYRYAGGAACWELPGGTIDAGEDPLAGTRRELLEETGAVAEDWRRVAEFFPNPARQNNRFHGFVARRARVVQPPALDEGEVIESRFFSLAEIAEMIADGRYAQGNHIALLFLGLRMLGLRLP